MSTPISSQQNPTARNNKNSTNEADIIFNRANVALARSQRLVASWLSPAAGADEKVEKTESEQAELQRLEDEMFTPVPERLGLGAPIPKQGAGADKLWNKTGLSADDKLRQTLLGRNYKKIQEQKQAAVAAAAAKNRASGGGGGAPGSSDLNTPNNNNNDGEDDDEEEEQGRSALGKSKKTKGKGSSSLANEEDKEDTQSASTKQKTVAASKRKGAGSFLDDLLSDRKKKRKK